MPKAGELAGDVGVGEEAGPGRLRGLAAQVEQLQLRLQAAAAVRMLQAQAAVLSLYLNNTRLVPKNFFCAKK